MACEVHLVLLEVRPPLDVDVGDVVAVVEVDCIVHNFDVQISIYWKWQLFL